MLRWPLALSVSEAASESSPTWADWSLEFLSMFSGLDKLHNLTSGTSTRYEVRADLQTFNESAYAVYDFFQVASSKERYKLSVGKYRGTAGKGSFSLLEFLAPVIWGLICRVQWMWVVGYGQVVVLTNNRSHALWRRLRVKEVQTIFNHKSGRFVCSLSQTLPLV